MGGRRLALVLIAVAVLGFGLGRRRHGPPPSSPPPAPAAEPAPPPPLLAQVPGSEAEVLRALSEPIKAELEPTARQAGLRWPPRRVWLLAFKAERRLELWGANRAGPFRQLATYPILAASGTVGPKRRYGDNQVPEGIYRLGWLNPRSSYHLGIYVAYPNDEDVQHRVVERSRMGGDIYLHGNAVSIGCLAMGDRGIESLFYVAGRADAGERRILIAPCDLRRVPAPRGAEPWIDAMYGRLRAKLAEFSPSPAAATPPTPGPEPATG
ncbi:MAG: hypothetical protein HZB16_06810 [Armatimonadetes bacterium]|nr:hypothetical protein [Armatimonadota bacterium]